MRAYHLPHLAALAALLLTTRAWADRSTDSLAPIVQCVRSGDFKVLEWTRLPEGVKQRTVETVYGTLPVSLADGYRMVLAGPRGKPFANMRIEKSESVSAEADRVAISQQFNAFDSRRKAGQPPLERRTEAGVEKLSLRQASLEAKGPQALYSLAVPSTSVVVTLYLVDQSSGMQEFATYEEYAALRDKFVGFVQACVTPKR